VIGCAYGALHPVLCTLFPEEEPMKRQRPEWISVRALVIALVCVASGTGCSSQTPDAACASGAETYCAWLGRCVPSSLNVVWGDAATCAARIKLSCMDQFLSGSNASPDDIGACASAVAAQSCNAPVGPVEGSECLPKPGSRANGAGCGSDWQCQSTYCKKSGGQTCGTCAVRAKIGELCDGSCEFGATCAQVSLAERRCVVPGGVGASCATSMVCQSGLSCEGGVCTQPTYLSAGMACEPARSRCDGRMGLYCNSMTRVCAQVKYASPGEACGTQSDGTLAICSGGASCPTGLAANKVCIAAAKDGEACNLNMNIGCQQPASCINNVCKLPDAAACM
jgi:hypothetical protein